MRSIQTASELYAHAIAIEREAAERYTEFAERMADAGRDEVAAVFDMLARAEGEHLDALERRTEGVALPALSAAPYRWLDAGAPETAARELVFRLMTPRHALAIALDAELRSQAFFEHVFMTATDPALRALAKEMVAEESEHVTLIQRLLDATPDPSADWAAVYDSR